MIVPSYHRPPPSLLVATLAAAAMAAGCAPEASSSIATGRHPEVSTTEFEHPDTQTPTAVADTNDDTRTSGATTDAGPDDVSILDDDASVEGVCARWNADRADLAEGSWTGSIAACDAGEVLEPSHANTLRQVNLYRWLAGLEPVASDPYIDAEAQACSLLMHANKSLTHAVPANWTCYEPVGAKAAGLSNIATMPAVFAVDMYMGDGGVETLGHRRWILSNSLGPIGIGSTSQYSCLRVIGGTGKANHAWTAWPPPGIVPVDAIARAGNGGNLSVDAAGWSIQSDGISFDRASVTVTRDGDPVDVTTDVLAAGYGSSFAIGIHPQGWTTTAGHTYHVAVDGVSAPIAYDVTVVSCD